MMSLMALTTLLLVLLLTVVQTSLSNKENISDPYLLPLESGFESLKYSSLLSSPFFMLAVLFVFFDMELILLLPGILFYHGSAKTVVSWTFLATIVVLTLALEWASCGLKWST